MNWESSALWGIIGLLGGFIFSFLFYKLSEKKKKIICSKNFQLLITNNISQIEGLQILYTDKPIKDLTTTTITITSIGKETIEMTDFAQLSPLCLKTTGVFLLQDNIESILTSNSNPNSIIKPELINSSEIGINFDYIAPRDSITFTLFHTGEVSLNGDLKNGTIIHSDSGKRIDSVLITMAGIVSGFLITSSVLIYMMDSQIGAFAYNIILKPILSTITGSAIIIFGLYAYRKIFKIS